MQHGAFVMLREVRQREFFDELRSAAAFSAKTKSGQGQLPPSPRSA
jgi:hypothetical protein